MELCCPAGTGSVEGLNSSFPLVLSLNPNPASDQATITVVTQFSGKAAVKVQRGLTCWYHENGNLKNIVHHTADRACSDYFSFREDGTLRAGQAIPLDDSDGWIYLHTYPGGRPRWEVAVRNGRPDGDERAWDEDGTLMRHNVWDDGWLRKQKIALRHEGLGPDDTK
jgi:hypothetical protein